MRRRAGVGAIHKKRLEEERYRDKGTELSESQISSLTRDMAEFKQKLEKFAVDHKQDIKKDINFRRHFQEMCATIGVDPLASSKGFWAEMLGVGDFYYELSVQIIEMCMATAHNNGGIMHSAELASKLQKSRIRRDQNAISEDDLVRAIGKLKALGNGFTIIPLASNGFLVQSVPLELSLDQTSLLQIADASNGQLSLSIVKTKLKWDEARVQRALDQLVKTELAWVDEQAKETEFWVVSVFKPS